MRRSFQQDAPGYSARPATRLEITGYTPHLRDPWPAGSSPEIHSGENFWRVPVKRRFSLRIRSQGYGFILRVPGISSAGFRHYFRGIAASSWDCCLQLRTAKETGMRNCASDVFKQPRKSYYDTDRIASLVFRWVIDVVDDEGLDGTSAALDLQAKTIR